MKRIALINIAIQILWLAVCLTITVAIVRTLLVGIIQPWRSILGGLIFIVIMAILTVVSNIIKAFKDPDVLAASELKMDVRKYKQYREWYDEHQRLMGTYGIDSKEEQEYFRNFFKQIQNPNEWRRYQDYRFKKSREQWRNEWEQQRPK